jgi:putative membrane protein
MHGIGGHHLGGAGIAGFILLIILWVVIVAALVLLIRALLTRYHRGPGSYPHEGKFWGGHSTPRDRADALRILHERYARGEIGRDEYLQRKSDLAGNADQPPAAPSAPVPPPAAPAAPVPPPPAESQEPPTTS